jgi:hypothetical protein
MGFRKSADGIASKGKTDGKNLGNDGPKVLGVKGGKSSAGVTSMKMKQVGRNMARAMLQKSAGRGR